MNKNNNSSSNNNKAAVAAHNDDDFVESIDFNNNNNNNNNNNSGNRDDENGIFQLERELSEANRKFANNNIDNVYDGENNTPLVVIDPSNHDDSRKCSVKSIRISAFPDGLQETAKEFDRNLDGDLSLGELAFAIDDLEKKRTSNRVMQRTVIGLLLVAVSMLACIFLGSIIAFRLSRAFEVDPDTGLAYLTLPGAMKPTEIQVLKTHSALFPREGEDVSIAGLSNEDLGKLKTIELKDGDFRVVVKGYARDPFDEDRKVVVLIEGGTMTYDDAGIVAATGTARVALEALYGLDVFEDDGTTRRLTALTSLGKAWFDAPRIPPSGMARGGLN